VEYPDARQTHALPDAPETGANTPDGLPRLTPLERRRHNLPLQLSSFIGREREIAEVEPLVLTSRLLTLTGSGGCDKTRLALEVANRLVNEFADGVWLVELAPLADPELVPQVVVHTLSVAGHNICGAG
jgi:hypothetical protein